MIIQRIKAWWQNYILRRSPITEIEWQDAFKSLPLLSRLNEDEKTRLRRLVILFFHYKSLESIGDLQLTTSMRLTIALQACLPVLNLGLDWYRGWVSIIIYPGPFSRQSIEMDEYGVEHSGRENLSGESWQRGPIVLSWSDIVEHGEPDGHNVVIHEFAHKLDMLNGAANGFPPLHRGMSAAQWSTIFTRAYADFQMHLQTHDPIPVDPYAATSPAEFFAVFSELFFEKPLVIKQYYPEIYTLLVDFYLQDPAGVVAI